MLSYIKRPRAFFALNKTIKTLVVFSSTLMMLTSCNVPTEKTITQETIDGDTTFGGFIGADAVQTVDGTKLRVTWTLSPDSSVTEYRIYNTTVNSDPTNESNPQTPIKVIGPTASEAIISGLANGRLYKLRVHAVKGNVNNKHDGNTRDLVGITYAGSTGVQVVSSTSANLIYALPSSTDALEARAYCKTNVETDYTLQSTVTNMNLTQVLISGLQTNTIYNCKVHIVIDGFEDNNTSIQTFTALGSADHLVFVTQPGSGLSGEVLNQQPVIHILDENDNIVSGGPDATALITLGIATASPTGGAVSGTISVNAVGGIATFTDIAFLDAGNKILSATKEDTSAHPSGFGTPIITQDSANFNITPGNVSDTLSSIEIDPAINLVFTGLIANGNDTYTVKFALKDANGNPVPGIRPQFSSNILGDIISQPLLATDANGETTGSIATTVADTSPARILTVSSPSGLTSLQVAAPFKPGPANKVAFFVQPANSPAGANGLNEIRVAVQDTNGNVISTGTNATAPISLSISNNVGGANLTGTATVNAVDGIATFSDLGIDQTGNGYRLAANTGSLNPAFSNNFNITSGTPKVIFMGGPTAVLSGACSTAITVQLRDFGGNPSKAIQTTTVQLSGFGDASFYSSSSCGGSPLSANVTFTPGTDTRTIYLRNNKSASLDIVGTDASSLLTPSNYNIKVTPSKMRLVAEKAGAPGTPLTVTAGKCSTKLVIQPLAEDNSQGEVFTSSNVTLTGIIGSDAKVYTDAACTNEVPATAVPLTVSSNPNYDTNIYIKDDKAENLLLNVSDPGGNIATTSLPQDVKILASKIIFTGPTSVVSGQCSAVFTVRLRDVLNNNVVTDTNKNLTIVGVQGISSGLFYTSPSCTGASSRTTATVPAGNSAASIYFRGIASEVLSIKITDPLLEMTESATRSLTISPSDLRITAPVAGNALTSVCAGPFNIETLDGAGNPANVVGNVQANLSGGGSAGKYFSDAACSLAITSTTFLTGQNSKLVYFKGQYPAPSLTLTATDNAGVLNPGTANWVVISDWGWIGTASTQLDQFGNLLPFRTGFKPVAARYDGIDGPYHIAFSPDGSELYVADYNAHRILKYNYTTNEYVGWIGRLRKEDGVGSTGSSIPNPSSALCVSTNNNESLPGWCLGGRVINGNETTGGHWNPYGITVDDTYLYVTGLQTHMIHRHRRDTGEFDGWIGTQNTVAPTGTGTGGAPGCTSNANGDPTPGWCIGGNRRDPGNYDGDGFRYPRGITHDPVYIYVGADGSVTRYNKATGAFGGWIGMVNATPTSGAAGCSVTATDNLTPGWCFGGSYKVVDPRTHAGVQGGVYRGDDVKIIGTDLYVYTGAYGGVINRYNKDTGAFIERLPNLNYTWSNVGGQLAYDGTNFFVADGVRILKVSTTGLIEGWMGKVANNSGMSGNPGCNSLSPNDDTPGFCLGGTHKPGLGETSFINAVGIAYDNNGSFVVSSRQIPSLKKFNSTTGAYIGSQGLQSISPTEWSASRTLASEREGYGDLDAYEPLGMITVGDFMYVTDFTGSRIKKINKLTGELVGWIGAMTSKATGGALPGCLSANAYGPSPTWCTGASMYPTWTWGNATMISNQVDGIMFQPAGLATDGTTWLYVTDYGLHRIQRFDLNTGAYGGWIGRVSTVSPTGGDPGCNGTPDNTFTPGWCFGGTSELGTGNGHMRRPGGITYNAGNLYVVDAENHRVSKYNAITGAFGGWTGRIGSTSGISGCTYASNGNYNVVTNGWCMGGSASLANYRNDRGGGFNFELWSYSRNNIFTDGINLYITNTRNIRIDKFSFNGNFIEAASSRGDQYINTWQSAPANVAAIGNGINCSYPFGVWADGGNIYLTTAQPCHRDNWDTMDVVKMDKTTGSVIGWKGGISSTFPPIGGEPGCSGASFSTPGWCQGGRTTTGLYLGQFGGTQGAIFGDANYLYVTDYVSNRMVRVPK